MHCKFCFPTFTVINAVPAFFPVTFPFGETVATVLSDVDHFFGLSVFNTFKLTLFPADNVIFVLFNLSVVALTDFVLNNITDVNIKVMTKNIATIFFRFFIFSLFSLYTQIFLVRDFLGIFLFSLLFHLIRNTNLPASFFKKRNYLVKNFYLFHSMSYQ